MLWNFRKEFAIVGIFSLVTNLLLLTPTLYMLQVYDRVLVSRNELTLLAVTVLTLALMLMMAFADWARARLLVRIGTRMDNVLSPRVFDASFNARSSALGATTTRSFSDATELRQFLTSNGIYTLFDSPWTIIYIAVLFLLHPWLGWFAMAFAAVQCAVAWWSNRRHVHPTRALEQVHADANTFLRTQLRNAEVVESMGMLSGLRAIWQRKHNAYMAQQKIAQALTHRLTAVSKFVRYSQQSLSLAAGAYLVIHGQLSPGAMIASNVLLSRALAPIDLLTSSWRGFIGAKAAFDRLVQLLQTHPQNLRPFKHQSPRGAYTLKNVTASAPGRSTPILSNLNLHIGAGSTTVILGPSGAGKSTLARILVGIWPHTQGAVLLDGTPLTEWNPTELGQHVGYLPQDVELFEGTIAENIARFGPMDSEKIIAAAQTTGLHETILRLPKGYDTQIGEAGRLLSGGQKQRVGLARAMYGPPQMIVLDEPNANLDDVGEAALFKTVQALKARQATVILITHRPGATQLADQLLAVRNGQVELIQRPASA